MSRNSSVGILSLLDETEVEIQVVALQKLTKVIDQYWHEVSEYLPKLESICSDDSFPKKKECSFIISKVYYHLGEYEECVKFALDAGELIDVNIKGDEFIDKVVSYCIDKYIESQTEEIKVDERILKVVERMFERCLLDKEYKQVIGLGIDCRRIDIIKHGILKSNDIDTMLHFVLKHVNESSLLKVDFKSAVLQAIIDIYQTREKPDFFSVLECYLFLNQPTSTGEMIVDLVKEGTETGDLIAMQICFDLHDKATLQFRNEVKKVIQEKLVGNSPRIADMEKTLLKILIGEVTISLHVDFLYRRNKSDIAILNNIKNSFERSSMLHNSTIITNGFMHAGTTIDYWLRTNLSWLGKACNWGKFSATASIGVIHVGQYKESLRILKPYLPKELGGPGGGSLYSESGSIYALGLIHSNHDGTEMIEKLTKYLSDKKGTLVIAHGACFGLSLCALGSGDEKIAEILERTVALDLAVSGESAGIGIGLVMMGSGNSDYLDILMEYTKSSAHEKIVRGAATGMALINFGRAQRADKTIEIMVKGEDPWLRYGGVYMIGMAYCGILDDKKLRQLLRIAVSDPSDDVRRAAVINLGFLLINTPNEAHRILELLAESFNPHVRYGVAISLGIACSGTGNLGALELLEKLADDTEGFVRQAAYIGSAMILMQFNMNSVCQKTKSKKLGEHVKSFRQKYTTSWSERDEVLAKMGAIIAQGIIDAGGRNMTITCQKNGHIKPRNVAGMMMFTQFWFWYPCLHFLVLSMEPTAVIGLNKSFEMPQFKFKSNAKASEFAYPEPVKEEEVKRKKIGPLAILSQARRRRRGAVGSSPFSPFSPNPKPKDEDEEEDKAEQLKKKKKEEEEEKKKEKDKLGYEILHNPARVTLEQSKLLTFEEDKLYKPVKEKETLGILMLQQLTDEKGEVVERKNTIENLIEPEPPAPFTYP